MIGGIVLIITLIVVFVLIVIKANDKYEKENNKENDHYVKKRKPSVEQIGAHGERYISYILQPNIKGQQYIINNLLFQDKYGNSTQIDHVYINCYGIWVIETKNYSGIILGNEKQREWTHIVGKKQYKFYNPIMQNQSHVNRLSSLLGYTKNIHNIVVFLSGADISGIQSEYICTTKNLKKIVNTNVIDKILSPQEIDNYYMKINSLKNECKTNINEHIKKIRDNQTKIANNICPRCGGKLVLRKGEYGSFYGCENYPNCSFTKQK